MSEVPYVPKWEGRRRANALHTLRTYASQRNLPCCICEQGIDYSLRYPDPDSLSLQHVIPRSVAPELTWDPSNWAPAHLTCNKAAGRSVPLSLGTASTRFA